MPNRYRLHRLHHLAKILMEYRYRIPQEHWLEGCNYDNFSNFVFDCVDNVIVKQGVKYFPVELTIDKDTSCISVAQEFSVNGKVHTIYVHFCTNGMGCVNTEAKPDFSHEPVDLKTDIILLYSVLLERIESIKQKLSAEVPL